MRKLLISVLILAVAIGIATPITAQQRRLPLRPPPPVAGPRMDPMSGIERYNYAFPETGERVEYTVFVSHKVKKKKPSPLVIALHGLGGQPGMIIGQVREQADRHGYIVFAPMGYTPNGGYGGFPNGIGGPPDARLNELSEIDVMNVLQIALAQFNVDPRRIYLLGHSMGGGGARCTWASSTAGSGPRWVPQRQRPAAPVQQISRQSGSCRSSSCTATPIRPCRSRSAVTGPTSSRNSG